MLALSHPFEVDPFLDRLLAEHHYQRIDLPIIQPASLFLTRAGDKVIDKLVMLAEHHQDLVLRPEFTAPALALYIQQGSSHVARWHFSGPTFTEQDGLVVEAHGWGAELMGGKQSLEDELEIIHLALKGLQSLGITDWHLTIGHVGLQSHLLNRFGLDMRTARFLLDQLHALHLSDAEQARYSLMGAVQNLIGHRERQIPSPSELLEDVVPSSQTMGGRTRQEIAQRLADKQQRAQEISRLEQAIDYLIRWSSIRGKSENVFAALEAISQPLDGATSEILRQWQQLLTKLYDSGCTAQQITLQPDLTRNWEYYTGLVFTITVHDQVIAAGGRYDGLAVLLGSPTPLPAVGFAYYPALLSHIP